MPRNGSGQFSLSQPPFVPNTTISSAQVNSDLSDIATALTDSLAADGQTLMTGQLKANSTGSAATPSYSFGGVPGSGFYPTTTPGVGVAVGGAQVAEFTAGGLTTGGLPIGAIIDFAGAAAPSKWLLCFGQSLNTTTYAALFAVIGYTYGGSGANFSLPDLRGRATFGDDNMGGTPANRITIAGGNFDGTILGNSGGSQFHTLTGDEIPSHSHSIPVVNHTHNYNTNITTFTSTVSSGGLGPFTFLVGSQSSATSNQSNQANNTNSFGSSLSHTIMNPALILNKIIFAGV